MSNQYEEEAPVAERNPLEELLQSIKEDNARKAQTDAVIIDRLERLGAPQVVQDEDEGGWVDPRDQQIAVLNQRLEKVEGATGGTVRMEVKDILANDPRLTEEEKAYAAEALKSYKVEQFKGQNPQSVADLIAGNAKLYAPKPDPRKREPAAGSPGGGGQMSPGYAKFLAEAGYKMSDKEYVEKGFTREDDPMYQAYKQRGGR